MKKFIFLGLFVCFFMSSYGQSYPTPSNNVSTNEYISEVSLANQSNATTADDADANGDIGYDDFDSPIMYVNRSRSYTLEVSIQSSGNAYVYAWVDWDDNNSFSNGEQYILASNQGSGTYSATLNVPSNANTGQSKMRIILKKGSAPSNSENNITGETEDYLINISAYNYIYLDGWNSNGVPNNLWPTRDNVTSGTMDLISNVLPESQHNLDYIDYNDYLNVSVDTGTRIWASFIHEGASWKNTFAMYQYPTGSEPQSTSDIDSLTIIFPNTSASGSGGGLVAGDKVYYDSVPEGTTVAFALIAQGWTRGKTESTIDNQGYYTHYSNNNLNIESEDSLKAHNVTFWDSNQEKYILGFEDIRRDNSGCDQDFNDVLFYITLDPIPIFDTGGSTGSEEQPPDINDPDENNYPVEWLGFEAKSENKFVLLQWYVATQQNNDFFEIERSKDLSNWKKIGVVDGHGSTDQLIRYSFEDYDDLDGKYYYRIRQVDYDGAYEYSEIISIQNNLQQDVFLATYPNPVNQGILNLRVEGMTGEIDFNLRDQQGRIVRSERFSVISDFSKQVSTENLPSGLYLIELSNGESRAQRKVIVKN